ncbi:ribosomal-protein-alanine N-acetyltransferase [Alkalibacterium subtropicum]|uniref:Ribosomal-protein-alanine N-acetyltransferase n=1 Tax=Alkalibacterium subtropicum TaxID=753702 RepID=A0A1I1K3M1_9LACT|nr:ribosomal protein S18-alanine N-acetyltransferase [Alkalibacterium subtropicum]SFC55454.1 ribosomal-protein-alanine N-acetyltransferase [Alkalibacterium subtropicum]
MKNEQDTKRKKPSVRRYHFKEENYEPFYTIADQSFRYGSPWTYEQYKDTLDRDDLVFFVAEVEGQLVGYIGGKLLLDEAEIYTIVVSKRFQKKKIARALVERFKEECLVKGIEAIFLEVRKSNKKAQSFYRKNAFVVISSRTNYYTEPAEDALIMKCRMRKKEENGKEADFSDRDKLR